MEHDAQPENLTSADLNLYTLLSDHGAPMTACLVDGLGLWAEQLNDRIPSGTPALFLDRDGVIVEETLYLGRPEDVRMIASAANAIRRANALGVAVVVVTNQAGIGRGFYDWPAFAAVQKNINSNLAAHGATIDLVLACAYHDSGLGPLAVADHPWRKPNPGMIHAAAHRLAIDLPRSLIVGDKRSDLEAGQRAGLERGTLVLTGHGVSEVANCSKSLLAPMQYSVAADLGAALTQASADGWPKSPRSAPKLAS